MRSLRARLKHAFAVDPEGTAEPTPAQQEAVDWVCRQVAKRHLTTPGLVGLEMLRPLNWIASQGMHFFSPGVWIVTPGQLHLQYKQFATFLEQRGSIEYLARRIEHFEQEFERQEKQARQKRAEAKCSGDAPGDDWRKTRGDGP